VTAAVNAVKRSEAASSHSNHQVGDDLAQAVRIADHNARHGCGSVVSQLHVRLGHWSADTNSARANKTSGPSAPVQLEDVAAGVHDVNRPWLQLQI